jgi:hypothetical protein
MTRHPTIAALGAIALSMSFATSIAACTSSDPEVAKTAADVSIVGPAAVAPAPSASVLSPQFDPQSLAPGGAAPASSADAGHEHHHHHHP